ncbi:MAG TPA: trehalose-6-phosphate synthase, partial [Dehalococcoidia bacterium]|nr:trehalose-6-phosphate synthase [Dehalococcoidia bacterium]
MTQQSYDERIERLRALGAAMFGEHRLIIASNRGPIEYDLSPSGDILEGRGSGGVVTALSAIARYMPLTWISATMTEGDYAAYERAGGRAERAPFEDQEMYIRLVAPPRATYQRHYNVFCNPLLWFVQHYMWNTPRMPNISRAVYDAWDSGYVVVNRMFADAIVDEADRLQDGRCFVMLHDYHLYLAPGMVRERLPEARIQHFTHIPWPDPRYWQLIPSFMRSEIHAKLAAADIAGFQTRRDVRNFLLCCEAFLGAEVDYRTNEVIHAGHRTYVAAYPISVDARGLEELAASDEVERYSARLAPMFGPQTIVRVDRTEPSKNILRGFRAFELLLSRYPDLRGRVQMVAFLVPSRSELAIYQTYTDEIFETA